MSKLAEKVQQELLQAIDNDDLVLPTLPEVALRVREAAEDPDIGIPQLSKVIGNDAALTARIIKVVNSPLLRTNREITDLQMAVGRLGINYTCNLATGLETNLTNPLCWRCTTLAICMAG
jgi:HD-like signal output (HDOD) protein